MEVNSKQVAREVVKQPQDEIKSVHAEYKFAAGGLFVDKYVVSNPSRKTREGYGVSNFNMVDNTVDVDANAIRYKFY